MSASTWINARTGTPCQGTGLRARVLVPLLAAFLLACPAKPTPQPPLPPMPGDACEAPRPTPLRLLTRTEYDNAVRDLLGDATRPASRLLPREPVALGFDNNADVLKATPESVSRYLDAAEDIARRALLERKGWLVQCHTEDAACGDGFITTFGRRMFRRSLTADEHDAFARLFTATFNRDGFDTALEWTLTAMLQSPQFLYRLELGDGRAEATVPLTGTELASKLSFFLWSSTPDDALLDAADNGDLATNDGLEREAKRLLADARAVDGLSNALDQLLRTEDSGLLEKDLATYPNFTMELAQAWRTSLELYVRDVIINRPTLKGLLTSPTLFVDSNMGMYATVPAGGGFKPVAMPSAERVGLLTQPGLLARLSGPDQSSPVRRGIFVLDRLMCQPPPPPPAGAAITPPPPDPNATTRERFDAHFADPACAGCHRSIDAVGNGFEGYDGMGVRRDTENGRPVDTSGNVLGARDSSLLGGFTTVSELATRLSESRQVHDCFASHLFRYALGRADGAADACSLEVAQRAFWNNEGQFGALQLAIVEGASFRTRAPPVENAP